MFYNNNSHLDEKKEEESPAGVTAADGTTFRDPNQDVLSIVLSRMTLLESLVQQQAIDLHFCRNELTREREQQSKLQKQVVSLQTDLRAAELERQSTEEAQTKKWKAHFSTLQNQVLTVVTELHVIKDRTVKEEKSLQELATAVQEHSADQMAQRVEITTILTELKEMIWENSGYFDEGSEDCRVLHRTQEEKAPTTDEIEGTILVLRQDWESRFSDLSARVDQNLEHQLEQLELIQKKLHDLVESNGQQTANEYYSRLGELDAQVEAMSLELSKAQETINLQILQAQESTKTTINDAIEKCVQGMEDRSAEPSKSSIGFLEETLRDMAKEWDARIADVTTHLEAMRQKQTVLDDEIQRKIKQFESCVSESNAISSKTVQQAKESQAEQMEHLRVVISETLEKVEKDVSTLKETQHDRSDKLNVAITGIQVEHRNILKDLESKMDLFRGRVEYLASKIPNQEEDIETLKADVPKQVGSLASKYDSLVSRFEHLLNAVEQYNQEQSSKQAATTASLDELRVQLDLQVVNSERLFQESQVEGRSLPNMLQKDVRKREVDESCYPQLVIRPEVKQMLKQQGILNSERSCVKLE